MTVIRTRLCYTDTKMSSFWWKFHHGVADTAVAMLLTCAAGLLRCNFFHVDTRPISLFLFFINYTFHLCIIIVMFYLMYLINTLHDGDLSRILTELHKYAGKFVRTDTSVHEHLWTERHTCDLHYSGVTIINNERDSVSNHQRLDCLLNCWLGRRSNKTSKLQVTGLWPVNSRTKG